MIRSLVGTLFSLGMVLLTGVASGQDYPNKTIRIIAGPPGGGGDFTARQMAQALGSWGQPVIVDNRATILLGELLAKAPPDGYVLLNAGGSTMIGPLLRKAPYDPVRDFAPISLISREIMMLAVHPSVPVKSLKELIALAKVRPGELNYSLGIPGSPGFLGLELLKSMTAINMLIVPYKGTGQAITAVMAGESHLTIGDFGLISPHTKSGRLRALAVTSLDPSALAPGMPTMAGSGLPGFEVTGVTALWAPAKTPDAIISRLNQEVVRYLNRSDVKERFLSAEMEVVGSSPEQLAARLKSDMVKWGKVFKDAGIKPE